LRCGRCSSEWQPPRNMQSMFCPFCHAPLIEVQEEFDDLEAILSYLVLKFGTDILQNKQNTLQFLETFFEVGKREHTFLNNLYASGLMDTLFRLQNAPVAIQKSATKQVERQLTEKYGTSREWSEYVVGCVCKALGVANNANESIIGIRQSAEHGNPVAQVKLAIRYQSGQGVEKNLEQYIYWLRNAAESDYAGAQFLFGKELYLGRNCERNPNSAILYLDRAAKSNNTDAMCFILSHGDLQSLSAFNYKGMSQYLLERKNEMSSNQLVQLSVYLEDDDLNQAIVLAQLAYDKDPKVAWRHYVSLLKKSGTHESNAMELKITKDIAAEGNADACLSLARRYEDQAETENDMLTALYWYRMAAETGELDAQLKLGEIYETGKIVGQDLDSAAYWYKIAAYNGSPYAKAKISYKSPKCILKTLTLIFEDDSELEYQVIGVVTLHEVDYLVIEDPETKERIPVKYTETDIIEGFEIEQVDEQTEKIVLSKFGGVIR